VGEGPGTERSGDSRTEGTAKGKDKALTDDEADTQEPHAKVVMTAMRTRSRLLIIAAKNGVVTPGLKAQRRAKALMQDRAARPL